VRAAPFFGNEVFPRRKDGARRDEGKETPCVFSLFKQRGDYLLFMGLELDEFL